MARSVEWIGKTDDTPVPDSVKLRIFNVFGGRCAICTRKLEPGKWDTDHIVEIIACGQNREDNLQPLCTTPCHKKKTAKAMAEKAIIDRKRKSHIGPLPRAKAGPKLNGRGFVKSPGQRRASTRVKKWYGWEEK